MKYLSLMLLWGAVSFADHVPHQYFYRGEFSHSNTTGSPCNDLFQIKDYMAYFYFTGSGGTTAVLHLSSPQDKGFFNSLNQVGLYGGMGDFKAEKDLTLGELQYHCVAEGNVDAGFLIFKQTVEIKKAGTSESICKATAEYSGFP